MTKKEFIKITLIYAVLMLGLLYVARELILIILKNIFEL